MTERCEVCESFRPQGDLQAARALLTVTFDERQVMLCRGHAAIAENTGVSTLAGLRMLYAESTGQRSYIARRARALIASARTGGRRASDQPL